METTNNIWKEREEFKNYLDQINEDGLILRIQLVLGGVIFIASLSYILLTG